MFELPDTFIKTPHVKKLEQVVDDLQHAHSLIGNIRPRIFDHDGKRGVYSIDITSRSTAHTHCFYIKNDYATITYTTVHFTKSGQTRRVHRAIHVDETESHEIVKEIVSAIVAHNEDFKHRRDHAKKQKISNELTNIIVEGYINRHPKIRKAFDACHRGARNFISRTFKNDTIIINAKLTFSDKTKLEKFFEILEETIDGK